MSNEIESRRILSVLISLHLYMNSTARFIRDTLMKPSHDLFIELLGFDHVTLI